MSSDPRVGAVGKRLALLRAVLGIENQAEMAKRLKIDPKRYHVWEAGKGLIPVHQAIELRRLTGATLDYIYLGEMGALSTKLSQQLTSEE
jgi:DNA-binding XRE family transcriptional regulator